MRIIRFLRRALGLGATVFWKRETDVIRRFRYSLAVLLAATALLVSHQNARAQTDPSRAATIMVFDVSNSMWGQIDGVSKVEIAREVIGDLLADWDPGVNLGLVAYGHRRKGDCSDIEYVIPVGPVEPRAFSRLVNELVPRGKTPLTDAVRTAAEILNYNDTPATVILVSDGIESCNADPCALAEELERGGVNFTAHVVGFDVARIEDQRQLSCLADETGGKYLTADNASELAEALRTVAAPPPPVLQLFAAESEDGSAIANPAIRWTVVRLDNEESVLDGEAMASPALEVAGGRYFARAELGARSGSAEFDYPGAEDMSKRIVLAVEVSLHGPEIAEVGTEVSVVWAGPDAPGDYIALATPGAPAADFAAYARTSGGSPAVMTAPAAPGEYELRYVAAAKAAVLASAPVRVVAPAATLEGPPVVEAGSGFSVDWTGPDANGDFVSIAETGADDRKNSGYAYTRKGSPAALRAPDQPGPYELRYFSAETNRVIARLPITVSAASATLEAAPTANAGADIAVTWVGPDSQNDFVTIVAAGTEEGKRGNYTYTRKGNPLKLRAPDEPGAFELRYSSGQAHATLATLPITVVETAASLEAAPTANAGADVSVAWVGPDNQNDFVTIVATGTEEGKHGNYTYTRNGNPLKVRAPDEPGAYELRYTAGQSRATLAVLPLTVTAVTAALEAAPAVNAGAPIPVSWTGPDNRNDHIGIVEAGADDDARPPHYAYTRKGDPAEVGSHETPGAYELRYISGQSRQVLARLPITLNPVTATLEAPPVVAADQPFQVIWTGPDNPNDLVAIAAPAAEQKKTEAYTYTRRGTPLTVKAPKTPGQYELRYLTARDKNILARLPITVK
jgi:Ca-activated chloride channel family protein